MLELLHKVNYMAVPTKKIEQVLTEKPNVYSENLRYTYIFSMSSNNDTKGFVLH